MAEYNFLCSRWAANKVIIGKLGEKEKKPIKLEICSIWKEGNWITLKIRKSYGNMMPKKQAEVHKSKKRRCYGFNHSTGIQGAYHNTQDH